MKEVTTKEKADNALIASFPSTQQELAARRLNARYTSVNALMRFHFWDFLADPEVGQYIEPLRDSDSVTGMVKYDHFRAASRILELAKEKGIGTIASLKPADCLTVLRKTMDYYELMPRQRQKAIDAMEAEAMATSTEG